MEYNRNEQYGGTLEVWAGYTSPKGSCPNLHQLTVACGNECRPNVARSSNFSWEDRDMDYYIKSLTLTCWLPTLKAPGRPERTYGLYSIQRWLVWNLSADIMFSFKDTNYAKSMPLHKSISIHNLKKKILKGRKIYEDPFLCISRSPWCQNVFLLVTLTLITWLRRCLVGFSLRKSPSFPLQLINILREILRNYENHVSPQRFSHRC